MEALKLSSVLVTLVLLSSGCSSDDNAYNLSNTIEGRTFSVQASDGWTLMEDQGIDTYIGRIVGNKDVIFFDQGALSFKSLSDVTENDHTLFYQHLKINQTAAILHKELRPEDPEGDVRLSVYLDDGQNKNRMYVFDPDNESLVIQIFKTHRFK